MSEALAADAGGLFDGAARFLQSQEWMSYSADLELFFGVQLLFFVMTPVTIMLWRLALNWKDGFTAMFRAPLGRQGNVRTPSAALRFALFQQTGIGYTLDVTQAVFSAISCFMFICVAYSTYDPESVQVRAGSASAARSHLFAPTAPRFHCSARPLLRIYPTPRSLHTALSLLTSPGFRCTACRRRCSAGHRVCLHGLLLQ